MKISLLLPTVGRPTLLRTLLSLAGQDWQAGDEVMVLSDGGHEQVEEFLTREDFKSRLPLRHLVITDGPHKDWGHTPRNRTMRLAVGDYLCHFDDDDVALPGMLAGVRATLSENPGVHMFRMVDFRSGRLVWRKEGVLKRGYVSTQNVVHPNDPRRFGSWGKFYGGDSQFIQQTAGFYPGRVSWHRQVTCVYRPPAEFTLDQVVAWALGRGAVTPSPPAAPPPPGPDTSAGTS